MNSNKTKKDILNQIDSSMKNLSNLNEQFTQYKTQNFQDMDDIATSEQTLFTLFNRTKKNFTGIPDNHNRKSKSIKEGFSLEKEGSGYYSESSYEPSKESSIDDNKETKRVSTKKSSGKFSDKQNKKDEKNSRGL